MSRHFKVGYGRTAWIRSLRGKQKLRMLIALVAKYEKQKMKTERVKERIAELLGVDCTK